MKKKNFSDQKWNGQVRRVFDFLLVIDKGKLSRFQGFRLVIHLSSSFIVNLLWWAVVAGWMVVVVIAILVSTHL